MANQPKLAHADPSKDRVSAEFLAWQRYVETCHCLKPIESGKYMRQRMCRLCGGRIE